MASASKDQLLESLKSSLASGAYSDIRITCGGDTHNLHRVIVCNRAGFFARAATFGGQETQSGTVDLPEDEPETVKLLIQYLYEGEYAPQLPPADVLLSEVAITTSARRKNSKLKKELHYSLEFPHTCCAQHDFCIDDALCPHHTCGQQCNYICNGFICAICTDPTAATSSSQFLTHSKMYQMADKYEVVGLKNLAKEKFSRCCKQFWKTPDFHIAADHAFSTTPENDGGLRELVSQTIAKHIELTKVPEIRKLLEQYNGLALGILDVKINQLGWSM